MKIRSIEGKVALLALPPSCNEEQFTITNTIVKYGWTRYIAPLGLRVGKSVTQIIYIIKTGHPLWDYTLIC